MRGRVDRRMGLGNARKLVWKSRKGVEREGKVGGKMKGLDMERNHRGGGREGRNWLGILMDVWQLVWRQECRKEHGIWQASLCTCVGWLVCT